MILMAGIVKTGVPGLDDIFEKRGFIENSSVLVSGEPGAGKSILAMEFIVNGAKQFGEKGLYVSSEQSLEKIREIASGLGMPLEEFEKKNLVILEKIDISKGGEMIPERIIDLIKSKKPKRIVLDSITPLEFLSEDKREFRLKMLGFLEQISRNKATFIATAERHLTEFDRISFNPEDFLFDGLIIMGRQRKTANYLRVLSVIKMRGTKHSEELHPVEIDNNGLKILKIKD